MKCERCKIPTECELMAACYPWSEQTWICPECGSTYVYEWDRENKVQGELITSIEPLDVTILEE
jgi:hypothetical protein